MNILLKHILATLLIALSSFTMAQSGLISEEAFAQRYLTVLSQKLPHVAFSITGPLRIEGTDQTGKLVTSFLDNAYRSYALIPEDLDAVIEEYTQSAFQTFAPEASINPYRIVPMIKHRSYLEGWEKSAGVSSDQMAQQMVWETYNEDLIVVYAEDGPSSLRYVSPNDIAPLNIHKDSLSSHAVENMYNLIPSIEKMGEAGSYMLVAGGTFEASLLLMSDIWTQDNFPVKGDIVVAVPNRDVVFIMGSEDTATLKRLKAPIQESHDNGDHPISTAFYRWNGETFEKWK